ncbi:hypothetical protein [Pyxidicoccus xibeiensis]|uniref:hypothetical protein n=1 Tax=Pyxidicoccus xibeiensis TaxID=2906759 RepID=UPI0020A7983C|nr:hypothetical protein [Pyxidicoccus xibeiensis]MCP3139390.1 hypothetical protein [Pyxidicoccus xibeiensis]
MYPSTLCGGTPAHEIRTPYNDMVSRGYSPLPAGWATRDQARVSRRGTATYGWTLHETF